MYHQIPLFFRLFFSLSAFLQKRKFSLSYHSKRFCQYPIVWVPNYRYRILKGQICHDVANYIGMLGQSIKKGFVLSQKRSPNEII